MFNLSGEVFSTHNGTTAPNHWETVTLSYNPPGSTATAGPGSSPGGGPAGFPGAPGLTSPGPPAPAPPEPSLAPAVGLGSMEKWFIATGSIIAAVVVLFCLNMCIQYRGVIQRLCLRWRRRNDMLEAEKRVHRDRNLLGGGAFTDDGRTRTHIFLKSIV